MPDPRELLMIEPMAEFACEHYCWKYRAGTSYVYNGQLFIAAHYAGRVVNGLLTLDRKGFQKRQIYLSDLRMRAALNKKPRYQPTGG